MRALIVLVALAIVCVTRAGAAELSSFTLFDREWSEQSCSTLPLESPYLAVADVNTGEVQPDEGSIGCGFEFRIGSVYATNIFRTNEQSISDEQFKTDLQDMSPEFSEEVYDKFADLHLKFFPWDSEKIKMRSGAEEDHWEIGVVAQEVQKVFPDAVRTYEEAIRDGANSTTTEVHYVNMDYMSYLQMTVVQQLQKRVESLEKQLADIQAEQENGFMTVLEQALKDFRGGRD